MRLDDVEKLEYLLSRDDIRLNRRCAIGKTPLRTAARLGHLESVKRLVLAGCDVNLPDDDGDTPLHVSIYTLRRFATSSYEAALRSTPSTIMASPSYTWPSGSSATRC